MPSRRGGRRSHHGCRNCKSRHLRCDELYPICGRCSNRKEHCIWNEGTVHGTIHTSALSQCETNVHQLVNDGSWGCSTVLRSDRATPYHSTVPGQEADTQNLSRSKVPDRVLLDICDRLDGIAATQSGHTSDDHSVILDEILLAYYHLAVAPALDTNEKVSQLYRQLAPELARSYKYINHAILTISSGHAIAALSDRAIRPTKRQLYIDALVSCALQHHNRALRSFGDHISISHSATSMSNNDCVALTLASVLMLTSLATQFHPSFTRTSSAINGSPIDDAVSLLKLQGPISTFFARFHRQVDASQLRVFVYEYLPNQVDEAISLPTQLERGLCTVENLCKVSASPSDRWRYAEIIKGLKNTYRLVTIEPNTIGGRLGWVKGDIASFLAERAHARKPEALMVLAYWAANLLSWPHWWGSHFADGLILDILTVAPPSCEECLEWPRDCLSSTQRKQLK